MKQYNALTFEVEYNRGEDFIVAKQTYVDRTTDKPSPEFPPDYALCIINNKHELQMILRVSKENLIGLGEQLIKLKDEKENGE